MAKKSQKKKKKNFSGLLLLLFLSVVLLTTSTYAWFTANKTVSISDINVNVEAKGGIQISTDATSWKTLISNADITAGYTVEGVADKNMLPTLLNAVSADGATTGGYLNMWKGTVGNDDSGDFILTAAASEEKKGTTGDFVAFDIFLRTDSAGPLYLEKGSGTDVTSGSNDKGLQNAARIALVTEGNVAATDTVKNMVSLAGATDVTILEPNYNQHTSYGVTQAGLYYKKYSYTAVGSEAGISAGTSNGALSCDGVSKAIDTGIKLENTNATDNSTFFATTTTKPLSTDFVAAADGTQDMLLYANLPAGVTKIRVYMWVEGQDVDCENNASGAYLTYKLSFTQTPPTT